MSAKPTIYLAGAIDKVPPEFATTWRLHATKALEHKYNILDPTAGKDPAQIVESDLSAIMRSNIILAEVSRTDIPYHGTSMEIMFSYINGKKVYVWGGCKSYWIRYHTTKIFKFVGDAIRYLLES